MLSLFQDSKLPRKYVAIDTSPVISITPVIIKILKTLEFSRPIINMPVTRKTTETPENHKCGFALKF